MTSILAVTFNNAPNELDINNLVSLLKDDEYWFNTVMFDSVSFLHLINYIVETYGLEESYSDIIRKSINTRFYYPQFPVSSFSLTFAVLDYLYAHYADTKLKDCTILHMLYMYDFEIFIFNSSYINYTLPTFINEGINVVDSLKDSLSFRSFVPKFGLLHLYGKFDKIYLDALCSSLGISNSWKILELSP